MDRQCCFHFEPLFKDAAIISLFTVLNGFFWDGYCYFIIFLLFFFCSFIRASSKSQWTAKFPGATILPRIEIHQRSNEFHRSVINKNRDLLSIAYQNMVLITIEECNLPLQRLWWIMNIKETSLNSFQANRPIFLSKPENIRKPELF